jgi:hypothetical protein
LQIQFALYLKKLYPSFRKVEKRILSQGHSHGQFFKAQTGLEYGLLDVARKWSRMDLFSAELLIRF